MVLQAGDRQAFQRLMLRERRQQACEAAGQHGFTGAGRPNQQQVMPAGGGDLQCPLGLFLTDDVAQIGAVAGGVRSGRRGRHRQFALAEQKGADFQQVPGGMGARLCDQADLGGVVRREISCRPASAAASAAGIAPLTARSAPDSASSPRNS